MPRDGRKIQFPCSIKTYFQRFSERFILFVVWNDVEHILVGFSRHCFDDDGEDEYSESEKPAFDLKPGVSKMI
jgi:hypothetical protein